MLLHDLRRCLSFRNALATALACIALGTTAHGSIIHDPTGDTFGSGSPAHDIVSVTYNTSGTNVRIHVTLTSTVSAPSAGLTDSIEGYIDIDVDKNAATGSDVSPGNRTHLDQFGLGAPASGLGVEYFVDIGSELLQAGFVDVVRTSDNTVATTAAITFSTNSFEVLIPLLLLGTSDIHVGAIVGPFAGVSAFSATDQAPNLTGVVPEPSTGLIVTLGALAYGAAFRHRREG